MKLSYLGDHDVTTATGIDADRGPDRVHQLHAELIEPLLTALANADYVGALLLLPRVTDFLRGTQPQLDAAAAAAMAEYAAKAAIAASSSATRNKFRQRQQAAKLIQHAQSLADTAAAALKTLDELQSAAGKPFVAAILQVQLDDTVSLRLRTHTPADLQQLAEAAVALAAEVVDKMLKQRRHAACKLLMFTLQTLDRRHSASASFFFVKWEDAALIRQLAEWHTTRISELTGGRLQIIARGFDGAHANLCHSNVDEMLATSLPAVRNAALEESAELKQAALAAAEGRQQTQALKAAAAELFAKRAPHWPLDRRLYLAGSELHSLRSKVEPSLRLPLVFEALQVFIGSEAAPPDFSALQEACADVAVAVAVPAAADEAVHATAGNAAHASARSAAADALATAASAAAAAAAMAASAAAAAANDAGTSAATDLAAAANLADLVSSAQAVTGSFWGKKCHLCKHCTTPSLKKACLYFKAKREATEEGFPGLVAIACREQSGLPDALRAELQALLKGGTPHAATPPQQPRAEPAAEVPDEPMHDAADSDTQPAAAAGSPPGAYAAVRALDVFLSPAAAHVLDIRLLRFHSA